MGELSEPLVTIRARVRFMACMYPHMLCQITGVEESFGAMRTLVVLVSAFMFVNSASVNGQSYLGIKHL